VKQLFKRKLCWYVPSIVFYKMSTFFANMAATTGQRFNIGPY